MAKGGKARTIIVRMISTAQTGFFYTTKRVRLNTPKLSAVKYDPVGARHVTSSRKSLFILLDDSEIKSAFRGKSEDEEIMFDVDLAGVCTPPSLDWLPFLGWHSSSVPSILPSLSANENPHLPRHLRVGMLSDASLSDREKRSPSLYHLDVLAGETFGWSHMEGERYTLQLNRTHLLFIPWLAVAHGPDSSSGAVVQICLRGDDGQGNISNIFSAEQASITRTIETLLVGHVNALHKLPKRVIIKEAVSEYTLIGVRKPWKYGRGKQFCLGDITLQPAEHKWIFRFELAK